jgi:uncharacterized membrane protein
MSYQNGQQSSNRIRTVGLVFFLLASLSHWFLQSSARLGGDVVDAVTGLLYGVAIACLLLSLRRRDRECRGSRA